MKNPILLLAFLLISFTNSFGQQPVQFALVDLDTIENYLINQIKFDDSLSIKNYQFGKHIVKIFRKDYDEVSEMQMRSCPSREWMDQHIEYLEDFQKQIEKLEKEYMAIVEKCKLKQKENINRLLELKFAKFKTQNNYQLIPTKGILYSNGKYQNVSNDFIQFIRQESDFKKWTEIQKKSIKILQIIQLEYSIIEFFKNYKYKWVREKWS